MADYTPDPADVELVAEAVAGTRTDCDPRLPCEACRGSARAVLSALAGRLLPTGGRTEWGWLSAPDATDVELVEDAWLDATPCTHGVQLDYPEACSGCAARAVLSALAATGRLTPADATVRSEREYEVELIYPDGTVSYRRVGTERSLVDALAASPKDWEPLGTPGTVYYRDVTTVLGPWQPITEGTDG